MTSINLIEEFFNQYEQEVISWFEHMKEEYKKITALHGEERKKAINDFMNSVGKVDYELIRYNPMEETKGLPKSIKAVVKKDIESKRAKLYKNIEDKAGNEIKSIDLYKSANGEINGLIEGNKATIEITTVYAGGYNIQRLHYRTLVKVYKK